MTVELDQRQIVYLTGKTRQDIVNRRRYLARFVPPGSMTPEEIRDMLGRRHAELRFREGVYAALGGNPDDLIPPEERTDREARHA